MMLMRKITPWFAALFAVGMLGVVVGVHNPSTVAHAQVYAPYTCNQTAVIGPVTATTRLVTAGVQAVRICSVDIQVAQASSASDWGLVYGTGTNCGTGQGAFTPMWAGSASAKDSWTYRDPPYSAWFAPGAKDVCLKLSGTPTAANVLVLYSLY